MPAAKSWVLLANYLDKTMLRNALAFYLSKDSRLEWTPRSRFVELFFNGVAYGTYQLCEKVQVNTNRVNVSSNGWLIEVDARATEDEPQFHTPHMGCPFRVEWPEDDDLTDDRFAQIKAQFQQAEQALYADNFTDPEHGWRKYFDEASVVDWFLVNEIAKNNDAAFFSSCYMHGELDGKIVFGPVWDFDIAFGNDYWEDSQIDSPEGWHVRTTEWYWRFFQDPSFVAAVQEQFKHYYSHRAEYNEYLGSLAAEMAPSAQTNENIWHSMNVKFWNTPVVYGSYEAEVEALIKWFDARMEWMNENIFL